MNRRGIVEAGNGEAEQIIEKCAADDSPQNGASHVFDRENGDRDEGGEGHQDGHYAGPGRAAQKVQRNEVDERSAVPHDDAGVLQADKRDEQTDTGGDRHFDGVRNRLEDLLSEAGDRQQNENNAIQQNEDKRVRIRELKRKTARVHEKRVESHTGSLRQGKPGHQADEHGADDCGNRRRDVNRAVGNHAELRKHSRVDHEDIDHGHKSGPSLRITRFLRSFRFLPA